MPDLSLENIIDWMLDWHEKTGTWPTSTDGEIPNSNGEKWSNINATLHRGGRGLPKTSLSKLKQELSSKNIRD